MKEYWLIDNKELAEKDTLHMLMGMLEYKRDEDIQVTADEILQYIEEHIQTNEAKLNARFPKYAR